jgi:hypothetical protein
VEIQVLEFLTSAQVGGEQSASSFKDKAHSTHYIKGWVGPRAGLDTANTEVP